MAASSSKAVQAGGAARRSRGVTKDVASLLLEAAGAAKSMAIALSPKILKMLAGQSGPMAALLERYGVALEESRASGRPVRLVVDVRPRGRPEITPVAEGASAADEAADPARGLDAALAAARQRGRRRAAEILSGPDMLSAEKFAELIGASRVTVNAKRQSRQVLGLEGAKRGYRFPDWQLGDDGKPFAAMPKLFERLGGSPWAVYRFLTQHHPELGGQTGREALRRGREAEVIEAAESVARDFA